MGFMNGAAALAPNLAVLVSVLMVIAIDLAMIKYCLADLSSRLNVTGGDKRFWAAVIVLGGPLGQIAYWMFGRGAY